MKRAPLLVVLAIVFISLPMFLHTYSAYESARLVLQPNIEALSPDVTRKRVAAEVIPVLSASGPIASSRILVESLVDQAESIHKLSSAQAHALVRMAGIQAIAWGTVLAMSVLLAALHLSQRRGAA